ncbi:hypothetical protein AB0G04_36195 [Actinoplanes sp. NPDC023801]|uniref:hypothetical protein n=1 Tax=Actinoplanes sp. NPDC023801 TaxID=3154595 RepID=UPI0033CA1615
MNTESPRSSSVLTVLVIVFCAVLGAVAGTVGGHTAAGLAVPDPLGPTALPPIPAQVPSGADAYLPRVTVSDITKDFLQRARWICETQSKKDPYLPADNYTACDAPEQGKLRVVVWSDAEAKVTSVQADCRYPLGTQLCRTLAISIAKVVTGGEPETAKRSAAWAGENVDRDATTVIGKVRLIAELSAQHPTMRIIPAG